jgi:hypothetical protein
MFRDTGPTNDWVFRNKPNGKVLEADAKGITNNGDRVQVWDWWGGPNQVWQNQYFAARALQ